MFSHNALNPEQVTLMKAAFDAAWKLVEADASLASVSPADRRLSLAQALMALISQGERDAVQLANEAITLVRKVHTPSPRVRIGRKGAAAQASEPAVSLSPLSDAPQDSGRPRSDTPRHRPQRH